MKIQIKKRGELTTQQLVMIIVLVLSFAIILFFIFRLGLGGTTDREVCHDSVVKKSTPVLGKLSGEFNCKTTYTCISGGGQCTELTAPTTVSVDVNKPDEIYKAIAEEMANCWWMFGEGKLDYGKECAICNQIAFDEKIKEKYPEGISYKEFLDSLAKPMNIQKSNDNYLYYLYGVSNTASLFAVDKYSLWGLNYEVDVKRPLQGKFIIMTGKGIVPEFPLASGQISSECGGKFLTKGN